MRTYEYIKNFVDFISDIDDTRLYLPKPLLNLHLSWQGDMTTAASKTVDDLDDLIAIFEIKVAGVPRIRLDGEELRALNELVLGHKPRYCTAGAATDDKTRILDVLVPINLPAAGPDIYYSIDREDVSGIDTEKLTVISERSDVAPAERPLKLLRYNFTPPSTGVFNTAIDTTPEGAVEGFLIRSTTVPTDASDVSTVNEIELEVGGVLVTRSNVWQFLAHTPYVDDVDGTATSKIFKNWLFLDLKREPITAKMPYKLYVKSDDTQAVRIIPIERLA